MTLSRNARSRRRILFAGGALALVAAWPFVVSLHGTSSVSSAIRAWMRRHFAEVTDEGVVRAVADALSHLSAAESAFLGNSASGRSGLSRAERDERRFVTAFVLWTNYAAWRAGRADSLRYVGPATACANPFRATTPENGRT